MNRKSLGMRWAALLLCLSACSTPSPNYFAADPEPDYPWAVPPGFPLPVVPVDNPMSPAKVELGRYLFYDTRLSADQNYACASCHRQQHAFSDGRTQAVGATGEIHPRNTMSLSNVAYQQSLTWADPNLTSLEQQALIPLTNTHPVELGLAGKIDLLLTRLSADGDYRQRFAAAFPGQTEPVSQDNILRGLAAFQRTLISANSPYDRLNYFDDRSGMSAAAWRGMSLFFSQRLACAQCHQGFNLAGTARVRGQANTAEVFVNTGLYNLDGRGAYPATDPGLIEKTKRQQDMGRFKIPTLRNIAVTAPYMHDGSIATLDGVIDHYASGGRAASNPYKSELLKGFTLSEGEKADLIAFLQALTDQTFLTDARFASPF